MGKIRKTDALAFYYRDDEGEIKQVPVTGVGDKMKDAMAFLASKERVYLNVGVREEPWPNGIMLKNCRIKALDEPGLYDVAWEKEEEFDPNQYPFTNEEVEMIQVDDGKTVGCGCVLHAGRDHSHVRGCPSIQIENLLRSNAELSRRLMAIRDSLDWLFSGEMDKNIE